LRVKRIPKEQYNRKWQLVPFNPQEVLKEVLNEENYETWKIYMRSALILNDLWQYVEGTAVKCRSVDEK